ncbi:MAG: helix-turn-helix domain-containing protein, partial [Persicimonas sp.]
PEMDASDQPVDEATDTTSDEESAEAGAEEDDEKATDVSEEDATEASDDVDDDADDQKDVSVGTLRDRADSPGELIASLRRKADLSLHDLSQRTHIGVKYLTAIEEVDLEVLPREVYLRGYLREIARIFDVEAAPLIEEYFAFLDQVR